MNNQQVEQLAKNLGYSSAEEFFKEMDKEYNLSSPKKFNVKVGKWV